MNDTDTRADRTDRSDRADHSEAHGSRALTVAAESRGRRWRHLPVALLGLALLGFAALADSALVGDDLAAYDPALTAAAMGHRSDVLTSIFTVITTAGSLVSVAILSVLLIIGLALAKRWRLAALVGAAMAISGLLTVVLKLVFGRSRPPVADMLGTVDTTFAFPSGHTLNTTVFLGLVALLAARRVTSTWGRAALALGWLAGSVAVAVSRVYLGFHWGTDVLGGFVLGVAILAATVWAGRRIIRVEAA